ncbi:hypothetical protein PM027_09435 [[Clostridium] symbiosum]|nr:hypothetical protein [[Clostridium] symbiosum]MDB2018278.1 hypothetical protein [[Clostridium] symbiosum]
MSDRNGKIFCTSIASLSHISKVTGYEAAHGWRWCSTHRNYTCSSSCRSFLRGREKIFAHS